MEAVLPMIPTPRSLIADDHPDVLAALRMLLRSEGWQTEAATSPSEVIEAISAVMRSLYVALRSVSPAGGRRPRNTSRRA